MLSGSENVEEFLESLAMVARIAPVDDVSLERTAQLINKSNQFNLTTRRRTAAEVLALAADPQWFTCTVSLRDRFGDNGLISVLLARRGRRRPGDRHLADELPRVEAGRGNAVAQLSLPLGLATWPAPHPRRVHPHREERHRQGPLTPAWASPNWRKKPTGRRAWEFRIADDWIPLATQIEEEDLFAHREEGTVPLRALLCATRTCERSARRRPRLRSVVCSPGRPAEPAASVFILHAR